MIVDGLHGQCNSEMAALKEKIIAADEQRRIIDSLIDAGSHVFTKPHESVSIENGSVVAAEKGLAELEQLTISLHKRLAISHSKCNIENAAFADTIAAADEQRRTIDSLVGELACLLTSLETYQKSQSEQNIKSDETSRKSQFGEPTLGSDAVSSDILMQLMDLEKLRTDLEQQAQSIATRISAATDSPRVVALSDDALALKVKCETLEREKAYLKDQKASAEKVHNDARAAFDDAKARNDTLEHENSDLKKKLVDLVKEYEVFKADASQKHIDACAALDHAKTQTTQSQQKAAELRNCLEQLVQPPVQVQQLGQDLQTSMQVQLQESLLQLQQTKDECADAKYKQQLLSKENDENTFLIEQLRNKVASQSANLQQAEQENEHLQQQIGPQETQLGELAMQIENLEKCATAQPGSVMALETISQLRGEITMLKGNLSTNETRRQHVTAQLDDLREKYDLVQHKCQSLEKELKQIKERNTRVAVQSSRGIVGTHLNESAPAIVETTPTMIEQVPTVVISRDRLSLSSTKTMDSRGILGTHLNTSVAAKVDSVDSTRTIIEHAPTVVSRDRLSASMAKKTDSSIRSTSPSVRSATVFYPEPQLSPSYPLSGSALYPKSPAFLQSPPLGTSSSTRRLLASSPPPMVTRILRESAHSPSQRSGSVRSRMLGAKSVAGVEVAQSVKLGPPRFSQPSVNIYR